jgi:hypothetical protein
MPAPTVVPATSNADPRTVPGSCFNVFGFSVLKILLLVPVLAAGSALIGFPAKSSLLLAASVAPEFSLALRQTTRPTPAEV